MRIYIIGAHSVGKTTLSRYISKRYGLKFLNEIARTVLAEKELNINTLRANIDVVDDYQESIFYRQIEEEQKHKSFVSDRSFDSLAYSAQHTRILAKLLHSNELKDYIHSLKNKNVTIFFLRPNKITLFEDGIRETLCWDGIIAIDAMIKFMLEMFELQYININAGSMQERIRIIENILDYKIGEIVP